MRSEMVSAMITELELQKAYLEQAAIETIYFGGGTPSLLTSNELGRLLDCIHKQYKIDSQVELTLEANPDDLTKEKLLECHSLGINRLSIGVQSFHNTDLEWMNRSHDARQAKACIASAYSVGIDNLSIDLIFGNPTTSRDMWETNLLTAIEMDIKHLSCYGLTVEPQTALKKMIDLGKVTAPDEKENLAHFTKTMELLSERGYEHYEISNYAKDSAYSRHNTNYWKKVPYLGIGPSAHSFNGLSRQWNLAHNKKYMDALSNEELCYEQESLSPCDKLNEYLLTGLRTKWGCSHLQLRELCPAVFSELLENLTTAMRNGTIVSIDNNYYLSPEGKLIADSVISDLFITDAA